MHPKTLLVAGLVLLASATAVQGQSTFKVGYINSAVLLEEAPGAREASEQFDRDLQGFYSEIETMSQELQQLIEQYDRQQMMLSAAAKSQREEEIRVRQQAYQTRVEQLEEQAGLRQQELVQPITERVNEVIEQIRAEESYSFIFDVAAGSIIAADPTLDLTPEVLRRLRAQSGR
jgi:outer membrane protein